MQFISKNEHTNWVNDEGKNSRKNHVGVSNSTFNPVRSHSSVPFLSACPGSWPTCWREASISPSNDVQPIWDIGRCPILLLDAGFCVIEPGNAGVTRRPIGGRFSPGGGQAGRVLSADDTAGTNPAVLRDTRWRNPGSYRNKGFQSTHCCNIVFLAAGSLQVLGKVPALILMSSRWKRTKTYRNFDLSLKVKRTVSHFRKRPRMAEHDTVLYHSPRPLEIIVCSGTRILFCLNERFD